ncbi:hypothetical protein A0H81_14915 [Grifola frondosa]|uniref:Uncharacterized protein n=1 Tax=Grifola frondosa TaxID=5627 RepID=A0A1C7LK42_GRIFR|nr:hypothetical protein A0H81_14915 [Grifola frondosa]
MIIRFSCLPSCYGHISLRRTRRCFPLPHISALARVKQEGGFDALEGWAAKEISQELELTSVEELLSSVSPSATPREPTKLVFDHLRLNVMRMTQHGAGDTVRSSATSVRSLARSTHSTVSRVTTATNPRRTITAGLRPDSKLTPSQSTTSSARSSIADADDAKSPTIQLPTPKPSLSPIGARRTISNSSSTSDASTRPKSVAASLKSTRSQASTIRKTIAGPSTLRLPGTMSRPSSTLSSRSDASTTFETAKSDMTPSSAGLKSRTTSVSPAEPSKLSPNAKRSPSTTTVRSTVSSPSVAAGGLLAHAIGYSFIEVVHPDKNERPATFCKERREFGHDQRQNQGLGDIGLDYLSAVNYRVREDGRYTLAYLGAFIYPFHAYLSLEQLTLSPDSDGPVFKIINKRSTNRPPTVHQLSTNAFELDAMMFSMHTVVNTRYPLGFEA